MNLSNLSQRLISAAILIPLVMGIIYFGGMPYKLFIVVVALLMMREWIQIIQGASSDKLGCLGKFGWNSIGLLYALTPCFCLFVLRDLSDGKELIFWIFFIVWATDTGAYFAGTKIGGPKLSPKISPKKTWSGLIGGIVSAVLVGQALAMLNFTVHGGTPMNCAIVAVISQMGDLLESKFKRHFGVKDSGNLIPGHGGILDRLDSIVTVSIYMTILQHFLR